MNNTLLRLIVVATVLLFFSTTVDAQELSIDTPELNPAERRELKLFEFEFAYGVNFANRLYDIPSIAGNNMILEVRLNRPEPFDFGVQLKMGNSIHRIYNIVKINTIFIRPSLFFDYNHRLTDVTFFAGLGVGGTFAQDKMVLYSMMSNPGFAFDGHANRFSVTPRVGFVLMGFLRVTADYAFAGKGYSCFNLSFGAVIGGSYRKTGAERYRSRTKR
jgi:hypothetical protein